MLDREQLPSATTADPVISPPTEEPAAQAGFSSQGPLPAPAVDASATNAPAATAPSASDQAFGQQQPQHRGFFGSIGHGLKRAAQEVEVGAAEGVGVAELAGLRYPVKTYEAQVDGGLFRGSRINQDQMAALQKQGIVGFVNLCKENNDDAENAAKLGIDPNLCKHIPILDNTAPSVEQMQEFIAFAQANPPTYVHCEAGKGRTGTAVACYRIAVDGYTAEQAIADGRNYGLSLINQINFIKHFERVTKGAVSGEAEPEDTKAPAQEAPEQADPVDDANQHDTM